MLFFYNHIYDIKAIWNTEIKKVYDANIKDKKERKKKEKEMEMQRQKRLEEIQARKSVVEAKQAHIKKDKSESKDDSKSDDVKSIEDIGYDRSNNDNNNNLKRQKTEDSIIIMDNIVVNNKHFMNINNDCYVNENEVENLKQCKCLALHRIAFIMRVYRKWIKLKDKQKVKKFEGMYGFINVFLNEFETKNKENGYSNIGVLNDFHHLLEEHSIDFILSFIRTKMMTNFAVKECVIFKRHFRDKTLYSKVDEMRFGLYYGYINNSKEVNTQNMLDAIYCHIFHSYNTLECSPKDLKKIESKFMELNVNANGNNDSDDDDEKISKSKPKQPIVDLNKIQLQCVESTLKEKQKFLREILGDDKFNFQSSKFCSNLNGKESERIDDGYTSNESQRDKKENDDFDDSDDEKQRLVKKRRNKKQTEKPASVYDVSFHKRVYYWPKYEQTEYHDTFIKFKYDSLKDEMLENAIYLISVLQWNDVYQRANDLLKTNKGKGLLSFQGWNNIKYKDHFRQFYQIHSKTMISNAHLISLYLYCNFDALRTKFIKTFNTKKSLNQNGRIKWINDQHWKLKHKEFANLGMLLREIVEIYGYEIGVDEDDVPYYRNVISTYLFKSTICKFNGPMSTTNDLSVSIIYNNNNNNDDDDSFILNLKKYGNVGAYGFDCQWISDNPNQSEVLFIGGAYHMRISSIINISLTENYRLYINAMSILLLFFNGYRPSQKLTENMIQYARAMGQLIATEKLKYGPKAIKKRRYHRSKTSASPKSVRQSMKITGKYANLPIYIEKLFHHQCVNLKKIKIDIKTLLNTSNENEYNYKPIKGIFVSNGWNWVKLDLFLDLYVNCQNVKILCRKKIILNDESYNILINVLKTLDTEDLKRKLNKIEFIQINESSISMENVKEIFKKNEQVNKIWIVEQIKSDKHKSIIVRRRTQNETETDCLIM